jgi:hypothetical protein
LLPSLALLLAIGQAQSQAWLLLSLLLGHHPHAAAAA